MAQAAKEDPDSFSRWKLDGEHKQAEVCLRQVQVPPLDGKAPICVWLVDVARSLNYYIRNSQEFADLLRHAAAQTPAGARAVRHLSLLLYADECTGGNVLSTDQRKKCTMLYFSFKEFGRALLQPKMWLPLAMVRYMDTRLAAGSFGGVLAALLRDLVAQGLETGAFVGGQWTTMALTTYIADFEGIRSTYLCSGFSGIKPCLLCQNVLDRDGGGAAQRPAAGAAGAADGPAADAALPAGFVTISCADPKKFHPVKQEQLEAFIDKWTSPERGPARRTKAAIKEAQTASGYVLSEHSLLANRAARAMLGFDKLYFDSAHIYWSNGLVAQELNAFKDSVHTKLNKTLEDYQTLALDRDWVAPYHARQHGVTRFFRKRLFLPAYWQGSLWKGSATQATFLLPLFLYVVNEVFQSEGKLAGELACLWLLFRRVRALRAEAAQQAHQLRFIAVYGEAVVRPKHHFRFHLPDMCTKHEVCFDTLAMEAKHQDYKQTVCHRTAHLLAERTGAFGKSSMPRMMLQSLESFQGPPDIWCLQGEVHHNVAAVAPLTGHAGCSASGGCRVRDHVYGQDDVLLHKSSGEVYRLLYCAATETKLFWVVGHLPVLSAKEGLLTCQDAPCQPEALELKPHVLAEPSHIFQCPRWCLVDSGKVRCLFL